MPSRRRTQALVLMLAAVTAAALLWAIWPSTGPAPRAREYLAFTACLLTDGQGVAGEPAVPVWAGMQDASLATRAKVQFLPAVGAGTAEEVRPYLTSLVQRHCDLVVAVGPAQVAAVGADAGRYPAARFVTVGGTVSGSNVTAVVERSPERIRERVAALVRAAVNQ